MPGTRAHVDALVDFLLARLDDDKRGRRRRRLR
jgi:hypothetical protein